MKRPAALAPVSDATLAQAEQEGSDDDLAVPWCTTTGQRVKAFVTLSQETDWLCSPRKSTFKVATGGTVQRLEMHEMRQEAAAVI